MDYVDHHPRPAEIYLIIEVSDSIWKYDCETKAKAYAKSGIVDYWVIDVNERKLHVFREPTQSGYENELILGEEENVSLIGDRNSGYITSNPSSLGTGKSRQEAKRNGGRGRRTRQCPIPYTLCPMPYALCPTPQ